jgi:hypothetical protein
MPANVIGRSRQFDDQDQTRTSVSIDFSSGHKGVGVN